MLAHLVRREGPTNLADMASGRGQSRPSPSLPHAALQSLPSVPAFPRGAPVATKGVWIVVTDDREEVEATVRSLLVDVLGLDAGRVARFDDETELFGALPEFDSMAVATFLTEMEERLGILTAVISHQLVLVWTGFSMRAPEADFGRPDHCVGSQLDGAVSYSPPSASASRSPTTDAWLVTTSIETRSMIRRGRTFAAELRSAVQVLASANRRLRVW